VKKLLQAIAAALLTQGRTLATAESCTGGLVGAALTDLPGSSAWYLGGVVSYSNSLKIRLLGVSPKILAAHGAVSAETAMAMAAGARKKCKADFAVAITGIAGPDGGTPEKAVGLVFMAVASFGATAVFEHHFAGNRAKIRNAATQSALRHVLDATMQAP
jgi:nicotinamide-nucleotide amidase